jgi:hypothetical protein
MSNTLYTITDELHPLIQAKAEKYGLKVEIKSTRLQRWFEGYGYIHLIQEPEIRQILLAFKEIFDSLPRNYFYNLEWFRLEDSFHTLGTSMSVILCAKWLDGLTPLFDREPETVLSELLEVLKTL